MSKILIVEDEHSIAELEKDYLELSGFEVDTANDGMNGLAKALNEKFDLFILDVMLPGIDGYEICSKIRENSNVPIIMVSAKKEDIDKIRGLSIGADDYMTKPFAVEELLARIRLVLRKHSSSEPETAAGSGHIHQIRGLVMDEAAHTVKYQGKEISLTNKEFQLLRELMINCNVVLSRETILSSVWGYDYVGETNVVDVYVRFLRQKIDDAVGEKFILTVRGVGYVIKDEHRE